MRWKECPGSSNTRTTKMIKTCSIIIIIMVCKSFSLIPTYKLKSFQYIFRYKQVRNNIGCPGKSDIWGSVDRQSIQWLWRKYWSQTTQKFTNTKTTKAAWKLLQRYRIISYRWFDWDNPTQTQFETVWRFTTPIWTISKDTKSHLFVWPAETTARRRNLSGAL